MRGGRSSRVDARRAAAALIGAALLLGAGDALAVLLDVDSSQSALAPASGPASPISGSLRVAIGQLPPSSNTPFDVTELALDSGPYTITLQPIAAPGLGVLSPSGSFLIPTLFVSLDDGASTVDFAIPDITGLFLAAGPGCGYDFCLETSFEIDTGAGGLLAVSLYAIPEPGTALLVGAGLAGLAAARRIRRAAR